MLAALRRDLNGGLDSDTENIFVDEENRAPSHHEGNRRTASPSNLGDLRDEMFGGLGSQSKRGAAAKRNSSSRRTASPSMLAALRRELNGGLDSDTENIFVDEENRAPSHRDDNRRTASPSNLGDLRN